MIGGIAGIFLLFTYLETAWTGLHSSRNQIKFLVFLEIVAIVGAALFPRVVGMALTPLIFAAPFGFLLGWYRDDFLFGLAMLAIGVAAWVVTYVIGMLRPEAT